jgi:hypothetical protein
MLDMREAAGEGQNPVPFCNLCTELAFRAPSLLIAAL